MQTLFNAEGSAYRSETGGLMEALRVLKVEQSKHALDLCEHENLSDVTSPGLSQVLLRPAQSVPHRFWEAEDARAASRPSDQSGTSNFGTWSSAWTKTFRLEASILRDAECEAA